ncbi:MAG: ribonuclease HII [Candidatus Melainabacteria bacterium]|nr:ribonuclease HII [Candidatus Melainabacteria bacterium]
MSLAKTKKKKRQRKLYSEARPRARKNYHQAYTEKHFATLSKLLIFDQQFYLDSAQDTLIIGLDEVGRGCVAGPVCTGAYSCSSFYGASQDLLAEIKSARQLMSGDFISLSEKDLYYTETIINEDSIEEELEEVDALCALLLLDDSKKVPKAKRENLCRSLLDVPCFESQNHLFYSINQQSAKYIDGNGIVPAIWQSMTENLINIVKQYSDLYHQNPNEILLLVDGRHIIPDLAERLKGSIIDLSQITIRQENIVKGDSQSSLIAAASNLAKSHRDDYMKEQALKYPGYLWENNVGYGTAKHLVAIENNGLTDEHRNTFLTKRQCDQLQIL